MFRYLAPLLLAIALPGCAISPPTSVFSSLNNEDTPRERPTAAHTPPKPAQQAGLGSSLGNIWESVKSGLSFSDGGKTDVNAPGDDKLFALDPGTAQQLVNAYRTQNGLKPLRLNPKLSDAALKHSTDLSKSDPLFKTAFDIYQQGTPANEFTGLPKSEDLMRSFDEQLQLVLTNKSSVDDALAKAQESWSSVIE